MHRFGRTDEGLQQFGSQSTHQIAEDIHYNDAGGGEFDVEPPFEADYQGHGHRQNRQQKLILNSGKPAAEGDGGMKKGEYMYYPGSLYISDGTHELLFRRLQVRNFAANLQLFVWKNRLFVANFRQFVRSLSRVLYIMINFTNLRLR